jgi:HAD superfamily hydrolase (TIGR01450 family)
MLLKKYKGFIIDLDGTIYRGNKFIPKAVKTINMLKKEGKKIVFVSNKTTENAKDYFLFLKKHKINLALSEVVNATIVVQNYLSVNFPGSRFYAISEKKFVDEIKKSGLYYSDNPYKIDILLVTLDRKLSYNKLEIAAKSLENGARFFAANIDDTCPVEGGEILDAGSTISALEKRTHRKLELNFGKPSAFMMEEAMSRLQLKFKDVLLIGDRLETDIAMGNNLGIDTALVETGIKNFLNGNSSILPTYVFQSIADILK